LWNHRQRHQLRHREARDRRSEIYEARRPNTLDIAPVGSQIQIRFEDVVLAVAHLEPQGERDLAQFAEGMAGVQPIHSPCELHRDRRGPEAPPAEAVVKRCARQSEGIDAGMSVEPSILVQDDGGWQAFRQFIEADP
jgi:hypothetical protein